MLINKLWSGVAGVKLLPFEIFGCLLKQHITLQRMKVNSVYEALVSPVMLREGMQEGHVNMVISFI